MMRKSRLYWSSKSDPEVTMFFEYFQVVAQPKRNGIVWTCFSKIEKKA